MSTRPPVWSQQGDQFVGLGNYTAIFADNATVSAMWGPMDRFWNAFLNTSMFTIVCIVLETVLGVAMALIIVQGIPGAAVSSAQGNPCPVGDSDDRVGADVEADLR